MAKRLIDIYFTLFKMILEGHIGRAAAAVKQQEAKHPSTPKDRHRNRQVFIPAYTHLTLAEGKKQKGQDGAIRQFLAIYIEVVWQRGHMAVSRR